MAARPRRAGATGMTRSAQRLSREALRLATLSAALPGASALTLGHRLPILAGLSQASAIAQTAELWRMTLEKPAAFYQGWLACAATPWRLWGLCTQGWPGPARPDLVLRLAEAALGGVRQGLMPIHARVTGNARRLGRRARR